MDALQAIFEELQKLTEKVCKIEEAIKETDLTVIYDECDVTAQGLPQLKENTWEIKPPKYLHDTINKIIDEFVDVKSPDECALTPTIQTSIQPVFITCGDDDPETVDNCKIVLEVPQFGNISITGLPEDQINNRKNAFVTFFDAYFDLFFDNVYDSLNNRYGQRDPVTGYFLNAQGNPVQNIDPVEVKRVIPDTDLNCINAAWFSALISWTVIVPLSDGEKHYADILANTLSRINACFTADSPPCTPVYFGERIDVRDFPPQLHLFFELDPPPLERKDRRNTWMVIPFPKFINNDPLLFDPAPFKDAKRTMGKVYAQARWKDFNPSGDTTAAFFDNAENAKLFFDTYIFPYCSLTPIESEVDPITNMTTKITTTCVNNKKKRLGNKMYRVTRILYLQFDKDGNVEDCREWKIPLV